MNNASLVFFSAPHRMMFFAGTMQALIAMSFWAPTSGAYAGLYAPIGGRCPPVSGACGADDLVCSAFSSSAF